MVQEEQKKDYEKLAKKITSYLEIAKTVFPRLDDARKAYVNLKDLADVIQLENIKKEFIDIFSTISDVHSELKYYNNMFVEARKIKKAEVIEDLKEEMNITTAKEAVYGDIDYKNYMKIVFHIEKAFNIVNSKYYFVLNTIESIKQSIGIARDLNKQ